VSGAPARQDLGDPRSDALAGQEYTAFVDAVEIAEADLARKLVKSITAAADDGDWRAAQWMLKCMGMQEPLARVEVEPGASEGWEPLEQAIERARRKTAR